MNFEHDLERLRNNDPTLTSLDLGRNKLTTTGIASILAALTLNTTLTELGLGDFRIVKDVFDNFFLNAAKMGDVKAQYILGSLYQIGRGTCKNKAEAVKWYQIAAAQGHVFAQQQLVALSASDEIGEPSLDKVLKEGSFETNESQNELEKTHVVRAPVQPSNIEDQLSSPSPHLQFLSPPLSPRSSMPDEQLNHSFGVTVHVPIGCQ